MYRALAVSRRGVRHPVVLRSKQPRGARSFSKTLVSGAEPSASSSPAPPKKRGFFKSVALYSTGLVVLFYATSPVVAANNERYNAFFMESVPFGEAILNFVEEQGLDDKLRLDFIKSGQEKMQKIFEGVSKSAANAPPAAERTERAKESVVEKVAAAKASAAGKVEKAKEAVKETKERARDTVEVLKTKSQRKASEASEKAAGLATAAEQKAKAVTRPAHLSEDVEDLVRRAESALSGKLVDNLPEATTTPEQPAGSPPDLAPPKENDAAELSVRDVASSDKNVYTADLPIGFEPPPGFSRRKTSSSTPAPSESKPEEKKGVFPLVAPAIADIGASEPVIAELASTIDNLAAFLKENPAAASSATGILDIAKNDLRELASRIDQARTEERSKLETQLDEQSREYMLKLLELEMAGQDKLDDQELEFKAFFEDERRKATQAYREKLEHELRTQSEIINERLKAEVIAQGIEMQRRWIREIKVRVEQERGGRLAKLDELATNIKQLERITLDNSAYLDENLRLHATWAALRALAAVSANAPERRPFRDELRVLRHASTSGVQGEGDALVRVVLDTLEATDVPDVGVEPLADLSTWFTTSVAPQVARVALVPEHDAGVLSYLASYFISSFRFTRRGLVEGNDVLSVLARAEYYMNEKDLDSAARELNQLKGAPKVLLSDWLEAARKRLEVLQALEIVQAQTTLASLHIV
ncbi:mitochondrial inner membrane protein Mitofilin [Phellopilus nigrolimitatus]|nr:mitochondrial inner membrane protein Mitofilin [Phellopilus nigrolimitatus]